MFIILYTQIYIYIIVGRDSIIYIDLKEQKEMKIKEGEMGEIKGTKAQSRM